MIYLILIIPVVMIVCGALMKFRPPKKINRYTGYRTKNSMKSQENWDFAQQYCGRLWIYGGACMLAVSVLLFLLIPGFGKNMGFSLLCVIVQTVLLCCSFLPVENALKKREGDD